MAKKLLSDALKSEADEDVKAEIMWRMKLLDRESVEEKNCVGCGMVFQVGPKKKLRQRFCENCLRKKFGGRP